MAQSVDASYDDTFSFGVAFWNDAEEELNLSIVAVDEYGWYNNKLHSNQKLTYNTCLMDTVIMHNCLSFLKIPAKCYKKTKRGQK